MARLYDEFPRVSVRRDQPKLSWSVRSPVSQTALVRLGSGHHVGDGQLFSYGRMRCGRLARQTGEARGRRVTGKSRPMRVLTTLVLVFALSRTAENPYVIKVLWVGASGVEPLTSAV